MKLAKGSQFKHGLGWLKKVFCLHADFTFFFFFFNLTWHNKYKRVGQHETERHLLGLGLAGVAEQGVTGSLVFGCANTISAHGGFHHCQAALFLHCPVSGGRHGGQGQKGSVKF